MLAGEILTAHSGSPERFWATAAPARARATTADFILNVEVCEVGG